MPTEKLISQVIGLTWKVAGVQDVINEIQINNIDARDLTIDAWISAQINSKITFDRDIFAINYKIDVTNGTIFLIGLAQTSTELAKVIAHTKDIGGVKRVVSHVRIKNKKS